MKFLIINSDALYFKDDSLFIDKNTGKFLSELTEKGVKIVLYHFKVKHVNQTVSDYPVFNSNEVIISYTRRTHSKLLSHIKAFFKLMKIIKSTDFLYLFYPNAFFYSLFICIILKKPFALYLRGEKGIYSRISRFFFRKACFVTSISPVFTDLVIKNRGNGFTIKPMIDFDLEDIKSNIEKKHKEKYSILYIGRVERAKGIFELIDALHELQVRGITNFDVDIIGNGEHFLQIKEKIKDYKITDRVTLHGAITTKSSIIKFYEKSDIFILPTHHEGFPRVLYEAMIFDVPIITTFVGAISYIMKDNFNCFRIEENNKDSIVEKLDFVLKNYSSTNLISKNATKTIRKYLETNNMSHEEIIIKYFNEIKN